MLAVRIEVLPTRFLGTKKASASSWRPTLLAITANLCDNASFLRDERLVEEEEECHIVL
jgi:hypothetical protein